MNKNLYLQLAFIFIISLVLRITYFNFALSELSINELLRSLPDTGIYWTVARHLLEYNINGEYWLFQVGAGYGSFLASLLYISGYNLYFVYSVHILLGALIPIIIYLITLNLLEEKRIALVAGLFAALSFTSITLSSNLVSDVPFVFFIASGILCFIYGMKSSHTKWFIVAGVLSGVAVYIRSIALFYPILFLFIPILFDWLRKTKINKDLLRKSVLTTAIMLVMILGWSTRNYIQNDAFTFGANGMKTARLRLAGLAVANNTERLQYRDVLINWSEEDSVIFNHHMPTFAQEYKRDAEHFFSVVQAHPVWMSKQFFVNMVENSTCGNFIPIIQIKSAKTVWDNWADVNKYGFGYFLILMTMSGLFILYKQKKYLACIILGLTYFYFTFFTGFTMWQGSRLHFPAEISFSILSAVTVCQFYLFIKKRLFTKTI